MYFASGYVVLESKTTELARHYERDFGAVPLPAFDSSAPRYLITDETAKQIFSLILLGLGGVQMEPRKETLAFGAAWYCRKDAEEGRLYEMFFQMCREYGMRWANADEKELRFIEEVTRVAYEREQAIRLGFSLTDVHPSFAS